MPRVVHFEIAANEPEKVAKFYKDVFGWKVEKWAGPMDYWMVTTGKGEPGIDGGISRKDGPFQTTTNTIGVPSVDKFIKKAEAAGGKVAIPKHAIPGVGYQAYLTDPDGNLFGIHEENKEAK